MRYKTLILPAVVALAALPLHARSEVTLGSAANFAVLAGTTVTNAGPTVVQGGNVGVSPGTAITGFPPGTVMAPYSLDGGDALSAQAESDLSTAYNTAVSLDPTQNLSGQDLGGLTLPPGVYYFATTATLNGTLTLDDMGNPNAQFVFQMGTTLATGANSSIVTLNGGLTPAYNIIWQVGSSATLGPDSTFEGHVLAFTSITVNSGVVLSDGSVLAINGAVTLDTDNITNATATTSVPLPATASLVLGLLPLVYLTRRRFTRDRNPN
jgi:Ice-binding-like